MANPGAPSHLTPASKKLFRKIANDYALWNESHALEVLRLGCEAIDRGTQARREIEANGAVYVDRFGAPRSSPWTMIERDARLHAIRAFRELSLDAGEYTDSRPPRVGSGALS